MPVTTGPAMEDPATQEFMRSSIPWVAGFVVVGAVLVAVGLLAMIAWGWHEWFNLAILGAAFAGLGVVLGVWYLWFLGTLSEEPWVERRGRFEVRKHPGAFKFLGSTWEPMLVLEADDHHPRAVLYERISSFRRQMKKYRPLEENDGGAVWVAGNPSRWVLVAPPDSDARFIMSPWRDVKKKKVHWWFRR